jgi:hypothetical protein
VDCDDNGKKEDGATYFKCYLGSRKTVKVTKAMKHSINRVFPFILKLSILLADIENFVALKTLLSKFPAHNRLYEVLQKRGTPPTSAEIEFTKGAKVITDAAAQTYLDELNKLTGTLEVLWAKQTAASKVWTIYPYTCSPIAQYLYNRSRGIRKNLKNFS